MSATSTPESDSKASADYSELAIESALFLGLTAHRPVGEHRHLAILNVQKAVHARLGAWVDVAELWRRVGVLYDLDALEGMSSPSPSIPPTPSPLSPIPNPSRRRPTARPSRGARAASSPLTDSPSPAADPASAATGPTSRASRSAAVIDGPQFKETFEIPLLRRAGERRRAESADADEAGSVGEDEPRKTDEARRKDGPGKRAGKSRGGTAGAADGDEDGDGADSDEERERGRWGEMVYPRAAASGDESEWGDGVAAQLGGRGREDENEDGDGGDDMQASEGGTDESDDPLAREIDDAGEDEAQAVEDKEEGEGAADEEADEEEEEEEEEPQPRRGKKGAGRKAAPASVPARGRAAKGVRRQSTPLSEAESPAKGRRVKAATRAGSASAGKRKRDGAESEEDVSLALGLSSSWAIEQRALALALHCTLRLGPPRWTL
ncbi:hypothetical protein Q5752_000979 [Cryptotrichosporon argae]